MILIIVLISVVLIKIVMFSFWYTKTGYNPAKNYDEKLRNFQNELQIIIKDIENTEFVNSPDDVSDFKDANISFKQLEKCKEDSERLNELIKILQKDGDDVSEILVSAFKKIEEGNMKEVLEIIIEISKKINDLNMQLGQVRSFKEEYFNKKDLVENNIATLNEILKIKNQVLEAKEKLNDGKTDLQEIKNELGHYRSSLDDILENEDEELKQHTLIVCQYIDSLNFTINLIREECLNYESIVKDKVRCLENELSTITTQVGEIKSALSPEYVYDLDSNISYKKLEGYKEDITNLNCMISEIQEDGKQILETITSILNKTQQTGEHFSKEDFVNVLDDVTDVSKKIYDINVKLTKVKSLKKDCLNTKIQIETNLTTLKNVLEIKKKVNETRNQLNLDKANIVEIKNELNVHKLSLEKLHEDDDKQIKKQKAIVFQDINSLLFTIDLIGKNEYKQYESIIKDKLDFMDDQQITDDDDTESNLLFLEITLKEIDKLFAKINLMGENDISVENNIMALRTRKDDIEKLFNGKKILVKQKQEVIRIQSIIDYQNNSNESINILKEKYELLSSVQTEEYPKLEKEKQTILEKIDTLTEYINNTQIIEEAKQYLSDIVLSEKIVAVKLGELDKIDTTKFSDLEIDVTEISKKLQDFTENKDKLNQIEENIHNISFNLPTSDSDLMLYDGKLAEISEELNNIEPLGLCIITKKDQLLKVLEKQRQDFKNLNSLHNINNDMNKIVVDQNILDTLIIKTKTIQSDNEKILEFKNNCLSSLEDILYKIKTEPKYLENKIQGNLENMEECFNELEQSLKTENGCENDLYLKGIKNVLKSIKNYFEIKHNDKKTERNNHSSKFKRTIKKLQMLLKFVDEDIIKCQKHVNKLIPEIATSETLDTNSKEKLLENVFNLKYHIKYLRSWNNFIEENEECVNINEYKTKILEGTELLKSLLLANSMSKFIANVTEDSHNSALLSIEKELNDLLLTRSQEPDKEQLELYMEKLKQKIIENRTITKLEKIEKLINESENDVENFKQNDNGKHFNQITSELQKYRMQLDKIVIKQDEDEKTNMKKRIDLLKQIFDLSASLNKKHQENINESYFSKVKELEKVIIETNEPTEKIAVKMKELEDHILKIQDSTVRIALLKDIEKLQHPLKKKTTEMKILFEITEKVNKISNLWDSLDSSQKKELKEDLEDDLLSLDQINIIALGNEKRSLTKQIFKLLK